MGPRMEVVLETTFSIQTTTTINQDMGTMWVPWPMPLGPPWGPMPLGPPPGAPCPWAPHGAPQWAPLGPMLSKKFSRSQKYYKIR